MIKSKKCIIEICNNPAFSKGYCKKHCTFKDLKSGIKNIKSKTSSIKRNREETVEKNKEKQEKRSIYFHYHLERCTHSEHSSKPIPNPTRSNICHILPKSTHPSLQDNLENCIYLTENEHERFDKLLFSHEFDKLEKEFEKTWDNICFLIKKLLVLCEENTTLTRALTKYLDGRKFES